VREGTPNGTFERYVHRYDESVIYEARKSADGLSYEVRFPGKPGEIFVLDAEDFERYYERYYEREETDV